MSSVIPKAIVNEEAPHKFNSLIPPGNKINWFVIGCFEGIFRLLWVYLNATGMVCHTCSE